MGFLKAGSPLSWEETLPHGRYIREHGVRQFLHTWNRAKGISNDRLLYGDEVEYSLLVLDHARREVRLQLRSGEVLQRLREREAHADDGAASGGCTWHQEYGSWMVEGTPAAPFGGSTRSLLDMERSMRLRRARLLAALGPEEIAPTMVSFPLMGVGDFTSPAAPPGGPASLSDSVPDACINPHPRFATLTANIRQRRGSKVDIRVPIFRDERTEAGEIEMDCMAYGMGCCCLQVTFQASDVEESRHLYDQLATLAPVLLALTAATPILRGRLAATDARWAVIAASVDDRTPAERGEAGGEADPRMSGGGVRRTAKSRYDAISAYISRRAAARLNDVPCETDEAALQALRGEGVDEPLARHLAHLFARDPLVAFEGFVEEVDDAASMEHFESLNSTNWQTVRWKPPPPPSACGPRIGWRTEFRSMEVQLTDFENAAFTVFVVLLTRAMLVFDLDLLIPLSKVDENMSRAHAVDAVGAQRFWFRSDMMPKGVRPVSASEDAPPPECEEMTMRNIICGKGMFPGLVPLCYAYLDYIRCDEESFKRVDAYLTLVRRRANGELMTAAAWMRRFVREHPEYRRDSVVTQGIAYDLARACDDIGRGRRPCPELLGDASVEPLGPDGAYDTQLTGAADRGAAVRKLVDRLWKRAGSSDDSLDSTDTAPSPKRARCSPSSPCSSSSTES